MVSYVYAQSPAASTTPVSTAAALTTTALATQKSDKECPSCPLNFTPVCGVNDKKETMIFTNECVMQHDNCRNKTSKLIVTNTFVYFLVLLNVSKWYWV